MIVINDLIARANVIDVTKINNDGKVIFGSTVFLQNLDNNEITWLANLLADQYQVLDPNSPADVRRSLSGNPKDLLPLGRVGNNYWVKTGDGKYGVLKGYEEPPDWRQEPDEDPWQATDYKPPYSE